MTQDKDKNKWYIKSFLGFSGWLGAVFFIFFFSLFFGNILAKSIVALSVIGLILIMVSYMMLLHQKNEFVEQFALANILTGEALLIWSIVDSIKSSSSLLIIGLFLALMMWIVPHYIHRVITSVGMSISFYTFAIDLKAVEYFLSLYALISFGLLLYKDSFKYQEKIEAISYGMVMLFVGILSIEYFPSYLYHNAKYINLSQYGLIDISLNIMLLLVAWQISKEYNIWQHKKSFLILVIAIIATLGISLFVKGILVGIILLLIGFWQKDKRVLSLGILVGLFYISKYYYFLGDTLLDKSKALFISSMLFGIGYFILKYLTKDNKYA